MADHQPLHHRRTSLNVQRVIAVLAISAISFFGLESLVYIANLYQTQIYLEASIFIYFFLIVWLHFIFDLHLREHHIDARSISHALGLRFKHFLVWNNFRHFQNYLILPGLIYWSSIILIAINFGHTELQNFIALISSFCLVVCYTLFKEIFHSRFAPLENSHFVILAYVKLYCAWLVYSAALGIVWYYCFSPWLFYLLIFVSSFMLLYQALFQYAQLGFWHIIEIFFISLIVAVASFFVYKYWNVNYFSAGLFLTAIYNLCWTLLFHKVNKTLAPEIIVEQLAIFLLMMVMVFGTTNFHSKIGRCTF